MSHDTRHTSLGQNAQNPRGSAPELPEFLSSVGAPYLRSFGEEIPNTAPTSLKALGVLSVLLSKCESTEDLYRLGHTLKQAGDHILTISRHYSAMVQKSDRS